MRKGIIPLLIVVVCGLFAWKRFGPDRDPATEAVAIDGDFPEWRDIPWLYTRTESGPGVLRPPRTLRPGTEADAYRELVKIEGLKMSHDGSFLYILLKTDLCIKDCPVLKE